MVVHPSELHLFWAQGRTVVIKSVGQERNTYLKGHTGRVCQIACSNDGKVFATGELLAPGFNAALIVWDFVTLEMLYRVTVHKESI